MIRQSLNEINGFIIFKEERVETGLICTSEITQGSVFLSLIEGISGLIMLIHLIVIEFESFFERIERFHMGRLSEYLFRWFWLGLLALKRLN